MVASTAALKEAWAVGGAQGVGGTVDGWGLLTGVSRGFQVLTRHLERIKDWNLHMCLVWLHKSFWPSQRRFPSLTSTLSQDALPPGQGRSAGRILQNQRKFAALDCYAIKMAVNFKVFMTGRLTWNLGRQILERLCYWCWQWGWETGLCKANIQNNTEWKCPDTF